MIELRPFAKLGGADHGWLKAKHHFSFASYYDPDNMGHGALRVWNDDEIAPNTGFPAHPHANMEIITYVREGAITHQDSLGNKGRTEAGDVQVMSAGSGIRHSEYNLEPTKTRIFQIWIEPTTRRRPADLGRETVSEVGSLRQARHHRQRIQGRQGRAADPRRRAGARHHAEGRRERGIRAARSRATFIWCRRRARSKSTACASTPATAPRSATKRSSRSPRWKIPNWCWSTRRKPSPRSCPALCRASTKDADGRNL